MSPGVASFSPSQRLGALGALIRCWRSQGSGSDWGHRETARVFQYVWCLSCNQARQSLPLWGRSFGDHSGDGALGQEEREGGPGPTLVRSTGGTRAIGLEAATPPTPQSPSLRSRSQGAGRTTTLVACPLVSKVCYVDPGAARAEVILSP